MTHYRDHQNNNDEPLHNGWNQTRRVGSRMMMWKQHPKVKQFYIRQVFIPYKIWEGPRDESIHVHGKYPVKPDMQEDFFPDMEKEPFDFDAVHTYAVVRQALTMYERDLGKEGEPARIRWYWNNENNDEPLHVYPYGLPDVRDARYIPDEMKLSFGYFEENGKTIFTCHSLDSVAHETGHAILDAIQPKWFNESLQSKAIHESFGDLTAVFLLLSMFDMVEAVTAETGANLRNKSFLIDFAEDLGKRYDGSNNGLRDVANNITVSQALAERREEHSLSRPLTGAVFAILADIFQLERRPPMLDDAVVLYKTASKVRRLFIQAIRNSPREGIRFSHIATNMINLSLSEDDPPEYQEIIKQSFRDREIEVSSSDFDYSSRPGDWRASNVGNLMDDAEESEPSCSTFKGGLSRHEKKGFNDIREVELKDANERDFGPAAEEISVEYICNSY